jgi:hypothetical protein
MYLDTFERLGQAQF